MQKYIYIEEISINLIKMLLLLCFVLQLFDKFCAAESDNNPRFCMHAYLMFCNTVRLTEISTHTLKIFVIILYWSILMRASR